MTLESITRSIYAFIVFLSLQFNTAITEAGYFFNPPCSKPQGYKIGEVDKRFNMTTDQFQKDIEQASHIWEEPIGKDLFTYNQSGTLTISLVFDERQSISNEINNLEGDLTDQKQSIKPQLDDYKKKAVAFDKKVADLNQEIDYWNNQGGAPQDVYDKIRQQQEQIKQEAESLNQMARSLNQLSDSYNGTVNKLNETIGTFNEEISHKPEQGIYDPNQNTITIYFNNDKNELIHTLAHEIGHSLKIEHLPNPKSIMFPKTTKTLALSNNDLMALKTVCRIKN